MAKNWAHGWDEKWESSSSYDFWNTQKLPAATDVWMKWILFYRAAKSGGETHAMREIILYANEGEQKSPREVAQRHLSVLIGASGGGPIPFVSLSASRLIASCNYRLSLLFSSAPKFAARQFGRRQFHAVGPLRPRQNNLRRTFSAQFGSSLRNEKSFFNRTVGTHVTRISQNTVIVFERERNLQISEHKVTAAI